MRMAALDGKRLKVKVKFCVSFGAIRQGNPGSALTKVARIPSGVLKTISAVPTGIRAVVGLLTLPTIMICD